MNKVIGIIMFKYDDIIDRFIDLREINFLIRSKVEKEIVNSCIDIFRRIEIGKISKIDLESLSNELTYLSNVICYCYRKKDGYNNISDGSMIITKNYQHDRIIFELLHKLVNSNDPNYNLEEIAKQYEDPNSIDKLIKMKDELDKTRDVLNTTIEKVLERGTNIEELVKKTDDLTINSQIFFKRAKQMNSCCIIL